MLRKKSMFLILATFLLAPAIASADLIGLNVHQDFYYPDDNSLYCDNGDAVVGGGVEYASGCSGFGPVVTDIFDTYMTVDTDGIGWSDGSFNGFVLSILDGVDFTSAAYGGGSMAVTSLSIVDGDLWVNFAGQNGGMARIDFAVPEPGTLALLGIGLFGIGLARRRKI